MSESKKMSAAALTRIVLIISIIVLTGSIAVKNLSGGATGGASDIPAGGPGGKTGTDKIRPVQDGEIVFSVNIQNPERTDIKEVLKVNGDISAENSVEIYPDTSGKLVLRRVSIGDYVSKGDVLASVDPSKPGAVYEASPVESTITGTVTKLPGSIGDTVATSTSIATIGDLKKLQIEVYIPEKEITWIKTGLKGEAELSPYPGIYIPVEITEVSPVIDSDSRTLEVKLAVDDKAGKYKFITEKMKAGMFASVRIFTRTAENVLTVPSDTVLTNEKGSFVYIAEAGNAEVKYIETGLKSGSRVEIISGLKESDPVIVRGQSLISIGSSIKVIGGGE